jgi:bacteriocin-like protein
MKKQFEISAYGVEELTQNEMANVEGGVLEAQDIIDFLEKIYGYVVGFFSSATFDSMRGSISTTGGLWSGGPDGEFMHQALHGI